MKKSRLFILLSVILLSVAGCATKNAMYDTENSSVTESALVEEQISEEMPTDEVITEEPIQKDREPEEKVEPVKEESEQLSDCFMGDIQKPSPTGNDKKEETVANKPVENTKPQETEEMEVPEVKPEREQPSVEMYDPNQVVSKAISKCQNGGMITTEDNLAKNLAEGKITQEEYNEYYPLDGLENSYYSVFVETDLNKASTVSGVGLHTVDGIAQYIADMLLLEQDPVFNITYAGITTKGGTDFYEFRCHR